MPLLDDLADFIIANNPSFLAASTFAGDWQDEPDVACVVYEYPGSNIYMMGGGPVSLEMPRVQVVVRAPEYAQARLLSGSIRATMDTIRSTTLNGTRYLRVGALDTPHEIAPDVQHRKRIAVNYEVTKEVS